MKLLRTLACAAAVGAIGLGALAVAPAPAHAEDPEVITISGAGPSGRWFALASLYSQILNREIPEHTFNGVTGRGVSIGNIRRLSAGRAEAGFIHFYHLVLAREKREMFADANEDFDRVAVWFDMDENLLRVIGDTKFKSISDLKGADVMLGERGSGDDVQCLQLLAAHGVTPENTSITFVSREDMTEALAAGHIDALCNAYARNNRGHLQPIFSARPLGTEVEFIAPDEDVLKKLVDEYPYFFIDRDGEPVFDRPDIVTVGYRQGAAIRSDLSDELVYRMTKALFDNWSEVQEAAPYMSGHTGAERAAQIDFLPYHPGAERYYKEVGAWQKHHKQ